MKILDRLGLLIRADAHGVMDQLEDGALLVKQHLREAELELSRKRARVEAMADESRRLEDEARRAEQRVRDLDGDVGLAMERGEEDLARFAVRRLLPERAALAALRDRIVELGEARERLEGRLRDQEAAFESLRARAKARLAALEHAEQEAPLRAHAVADEEVELELLRRRGASARDPRPEAS